MGTSPEICRELKNIQGKSLSMRNFRSMLVAANLLLEEEDVDSPRFAVFPLADPCLEERR